MVTSGDEGWRDKRRTRILAAAERVFSERSFADASMDAIAAAAGIGKPTLYRYFDSKDRLFGAVFADVLDRLDLRLAAVFETGVASRPMLKAMLAEIVPTFREHLVPVRSLREAEAAADRSRRRVFRDRRGQIAAWLTRALDRGVARDEFQPSPTELVAQMTLGMVRSATGSTDANDRTIVDTVTRLVFDGLAHGFEAARPDPCNDDDGAEGAGLYLKASA